MLLVGVPGLAKTLLVQTVAQALDLQEMRAGEVGEALPFGLAHLGKPVDRLAEAALQRLRALGRIGLVELVRGDEFTITTEDVAGDKSICGTTYTSSAVTTRTATDVTIAG